MTCAPLVCLVCGGRDFTDEAFIATALDVYRDRLSLLVHGDARGADRLAGRWAALNGVPVKRFPADWKRYGPAAGPIRNRQMLTEGHPDLVIAFPGGVGTQDMVNLATVAGVQVVRHHV